MYKIGEAARLLGLSTEALRYYERKGLIVPHKDSVSNYRYFDASQINHLLNMQKYQKLGFTLYELMDLFESRGNDMFLELMEQKEKELLQESVSMSLRLHSIHLSLECIALAERAQHAIQFVTRPALYRISYMQDDVILADDASLSEELRMWSKSSELQFLSARICAKDFISGQEHFDYGFCMYETIGDFIGIRINDVVRQYAECPALAYCFEADAQHTILQEKEKLLQFMEAQHLMLDGDILSQVLYSACENHHYQMRHMIWVPYKRVI